MRRARRTWAYAARVGGGGGLIGLAVVMGGCAAAALLQPPKKSEAQFILPLVPTVVVVENYSMRADLAIRSDEVASAAQSRLELNTKVPMVHWSKVYDLKAHDPAAFSKMTVAEIGRAVGASQVIYVNMQGMGLSAVPGNMVVSGSFGALVKVVDVETSSTLWPKEMAAGYPVGAGVTQERSKQDIDPVAAASQLSQEGGASVAQLFYTFTTGK